MRLAKLAPAAVISELWDEEGYKTSKGNYVSDFAREHALSIIAIDALLHYR